MEATDIEAIVKAAANEAELRAVVDALVEREKSGLVAKNTELLTALRDAKGKLGTWEAIGATHEDVAALLAEKKKAESGALTPAQRLEQFQAEAARKTAEFEAQLKARDAMLDELTITAELRGVLAPLIVPNGGNDPGAMVRLEDAIARIQRDLAPLATRHEENGRRVVKVSGAEGDKSVADYARGWAGTPVGKAYVLAPVNNGSGPTAKGSPAGGGKQITRAEFNTMTPTEREKAVQGGATITD